MKILNKAFRTIFRLKNAVIQNVQFQVSRANSSITPVKLSVDVYESNATDRNAPPLIIMHGLFGGKQNWRGVSRAIERKTNRKVYTVDARNHGDSPHDSKHDSAHMAADIVLLIQEQNLKRVSILGHSMGGRTMMFMALKYRELVEKAIIVDISPVSLPRNLGAMEEVFLTLKNVRISSDLPLIKGKKEARKQLADKLGDSMFVDFLMLNLTKKPSGEFAWRLNVDGLLENLRKSRVASNFLDLRPFTGPVLFIAGTESDYVKPDDWPKIKKIFPEAELKWIDAGHLIHFDEPKKFVAIATEFLKS